MAHFPCRHCGLRQQQHAGLCRTCERLLGLDNRSVYEREQERVHRQQQEIDALRKLEVEQAPKVVRVIDGEEFEVVWDGTA